MMVVELHLLFPFFFLSLEDISLFTLVKLRGWMRSQRVDMNIGRWTLMGNSLLDPLGYSWDKWQLPLSHGSSLFHPSLSSYNWTVQLLKLLIMLLSLHTIVLDIRSKYNVYILILHSIQLEIRINLVTLLTRLQLTRERCNDVSQ